MPLFEHLVFLEQRERELASQFESFPSLRAGVGEQAGSCHIGGVPDEIPELALALAEGGAPLGIGALLKQANLAPSSSEANRLIDGGGVRVDGAVVSDKGLKLSAGTYVVQVGKRKFARVTLG